MVLSVIFWAACCVLVRCRHAVSEGSRAHGRRHARLAAAASFLVFCLAMLPQVRMQAELKAAPAPSTPAPPPASAALDEECPEEFTLLGTIRGLDAKADRKSARILFHFVDADHLLAVEFSRGMATITKRSGKARVTLASGAIPAGGGGALEFALKRRAWRITLICNDRVIAQCYDGEAAGGRAAWRADAGVTVDLRLQATEPVAFADDFTRASGETGQWEILAGQCEIAQIAMGRHGSDTGRYSSNAFSWAAAGRPIAMSATGYWFWDNYVVDVSAKPEDRGALGIVAYLKDGDNFVLFRWTAAQEGRPGTGVREILRVQGGKAKILASQPGGFEPRQWYRLRFVACEGAFTAFIDGEVACQARDTAFGQGKAGLYARDTERVTFDDVRITATDSFSDSFTAVEPGKWQDHALAWKSDPRAGCRVAGAGEGITVAGRRDWDDYTFGADVTPGKAQAVGLVFACKAPGDYGLFRVPAGGRGNADLLHVQGGKPTVVAQSAGEVALSGGSRLRVEVRGGQVTAYVGDQPVVSGVDPSFLGGSLGLYSRGPAGARFADVGMQLALPGNAEPHVDAQFAQEKTMAGWASAEGSWRADPGGSGVLWHTGAFYGSPEVSFTLPVRGPLEAMLALDADGQSPETGYQALLSLAASGPSRLELRRGGKVVATSTGAWSPGSGERLRLWRQGGLVAAALGDLAVAQYQDSQPLAGGHVGFRCDRVEAGVSAVTATTTNVLDSTFSGPPTEWWAPRGSWNVSQRWPCDNRWSFFGSSRSETPTLWTKQSFAGNLVAEAWVALLMDAPEDPACGYSHPSDLHLTFCGNGKDLSSGYTLQFAALNNSVTRLLRGERVVAENSQVRMVRPVRVNLAFQRHWFHLRAEKEGDRIRCFVDGEPAFEYVDPDPIPGGQVALWTSRNGLMVARARVWYEKGGAPSPLPVVAAAPAPADARGWVIEDAPCATLVCGFESGLHGWAADGTEGAPILSLDGSSKSQGKQSLRVTNRIAGGSLGVLCGVSQFDAVKFPTLRFDYRMDPQARVNLYVRVNGQTMVIGVSSPDQTGAALPSLGAIEGIAADGEWHTARFDLLGALRRLYPTADSILVDDPTFRSPDAEYLRSGFGGNPWGASYSLDDFRLIGCPESDIEDTRAVVMRAR